MFRCAVDGHVSEPGEKPILIVTDKRARMYDNGTEGWEIRKEEKFCLEHGREYLRKQALLERARDVGGNNGPR